MQEGVLSHTANNLDYVGPYPDPKFYGADFCQVMSELIFRPFMSGIKTII